jgi:hypothetical protein
MSQCYSGERCGPWASCFHMHFPFRNLYLGKMPTKLEKNWQIWEGKGPKFGPRMGLKKSLVDDDMQLKFVLMFLFNQIYLFIIEIHDAMLFVQCLRILKWVSDYRLE